MSTPSWAPGQPIIDFGRAIYKEVHNQEPPSFWGASHWYQWFPGVGSGPDYRNWRRVMQERYQGQSVKAFIANQLVAHGAMLADCERENPSKEQDKNDYPYVSVESTTQGWSIWKGGQHTVPMSDEDWFWITAKAWGWVRDQVRNKNLGTLAVEVIVKEMVLPDRNNRRLAVFRSPAALGQDHPDNIAAAGWYEWKRTTGGNDALQRFGKASKERWERQHESFQQADRMLSSVVSALRYASLQEPAHRLSEALSEYFDIRSEAIDRFNALSQAELDENQRTLVRSKQAAFVEVDNHLAGKLPSEIMEEQPSLSGYGGMGVAPAVLVPLIIKGTVAIGLLALVAYSTRQIRAIATDPDLRAVQAAAQQSAKDQRARIERRRQTELFEVNRAVRSGELDAAEALDRREAINDRADRALAEVNNTEAALVASAPGSSGMSMGLIAGMAVGAGGLLWALTKGK